MQIFASGHSCIGAVFWLFLFSFQKTVCQPFTHRLIIEFQAGIGKNESTDKGQYHIRNTLYDSCIMVAYPSRISIYQREMCYVYRIRNISQEFAYIGEVVGTGIIGGMLSYPVAYLVMGNTAAALFTFVVPFLISTCGGTIIAMIITIPLKKSGMLAKMKDSLEN